MPGQRGLRSGSVEARWACLAPHERSLVPILQALVSEGAPRFGWFGGVVREQAFQFWLCLAIEDVVQLLGDRHRTTTSLHCCKLHEVACLVLARVLHANFLHEDLPKTSRGARQFSGSGKDGCIKSSPQFPVVGADWPTPILFQGLIPNPSQRIRSTYELVLLFVFRSDDALWFAFQPLEVPRCLHEGRQRDETFCLSTWGNLYHLMFLPSPTYSRAL